MSSRSSPRTLCSVDGVSKRYRLGALAAGNLRWAIPSLESVLDRATRIVRPGSGAPSAPPLWGKGKAPSDFWALRDVSFALQPGETVGILGPNGAGKSTLLKLIAGITEATRGRVAVDGRLSALIELVAGFHPDLTGRENVYLNASILGMKRREIRAQFDSIVAFAEMERFLDTPVKRYSSGMQARLGFAVAAHVKADLLLVDEVLAVGDLSFQQKCLDYMRHLGNQGVTVVLISHAMEKMTSYCRRGLLLVRGELRADGPMAEVAQQYFAYLQQAGLEDRTAIVRSASITDERGRPVPDVAVGGRFTIRIRVALPRPLVPALGLQVVRADGLLCAQSLLDAGAPTELFEVGEHEFTIQVADLPLLPALYTIDLTVYDRGRGNETVARRQSAASFTVTGAASAEGVVALDARLMPAVLDAEPPRILADLGRAAVTVR